MDETQGREADTKAIEALVRGLAQAWSRGDAEDYGEHFTEDASYTTWIGTLYRGRNDIVTSHRALFRGFLKGTKIANSVVDVRFYGPDTAVVCTRGDNFKRRRPADNKLAKVQTYSVVREDDGQWRIAAFHNTKRKPLMEGISFRFLPDSRPAPITRTTR